MFVNISAIINGSPKIKIIICFFIILLVLVQGYILIVRKQQLNLAKEVNLQLRLSIELDKQKKEILACKKEHQELVGAAMAMPKNNLATMLTEISLAARQNQLAIKMLTPKTLTMKNHWQLQTIHLLLAGNYHQFQAWLQALQRLPGWFNVSQLSLQPNSNENYLTIDIQLDFYSRVTA